MIAACTNTLIDTQARIRIDAEVIAYCTAPLISQKSEIFASFPPRGSLSGAPAPVPLTRLNDHLPHKAAKPGTLVGAGFL